MGALVKLSPNTDVNDNDTVYERQRDLTKEAMQSFGVDVGTFHTSVLYIDSTRPSMSRALPWETSSFWTVCTNVSFIAGVFLMASSCRPYRRRKH
jgi:hypothetical protein